MPYINVDEAYILDNTGLQVDQVVDIPYTDAALTDTQKAQARKNIAAGGTNPNLLDNPFFQVNQRNVANGVAINANGYVADRWQATGTNGATRNADGTITVTNTLFHKLGDRGIAGKIVTLSVLFADDTIESKTFTWSGTTTQNMDSINCTVYAATNQMNFNGGQQAVKAVKLELGSVSTLANDTPPNYADELDRCQYYFERISAGTANLTIGTGIGTGTYFYTPIKLHPKRTAPTVTYSGSVGIGRSAYETDISAIYTSGCSSDPNSGNYNLAVTVTNTTQTAYRLIIKTGGYIDFSADL